MSNIKGLSELQAFLDQLPAKMEKNIMRGAMRAGAVVLKDEVQGNVPVRTGKLRDGLKIKTGSKGAKVMARVTFTGPHAFLARWIEYGVVAHIINPKSGKYLSFAGLFARSVEHPGFAAKPMMRTALDTRGTAAAVAAGEYIKKRLTKQGLDAADVDIETD